MIPKAPIPPVPQAGPDDLWERLARRPRPSKIVDFPHRPGETPLGRVAIWVLQQHEIELAAASAAQRARRALSVVLSDKRAEALSGSSLSQEIDRQSYSEIYDNARACEILFLACRNPADLNRPAFPTVDKIREVLTADEVGVLMSNFLTVQSELGPISASMTKEDVDAWIERLAVSGERYPLGSLASDAHQRLTFALALRCWISQTDKSSAGSPPASDTTSGTSSPEKQSVDVSEPGE